MSEEDGASNSEQASAFSSFALNDADFVVCGEYRLDERLLAAAKSDNEELLLEVFDHPGTFDINFADGYAIVFRYVSLCAYDIVCGDRLGNTGMSARRDRALISPRYP